MKLTIEGKEYNIRWDDTPLLSPEDHGLLQHVHYTRQQIAAIFQVPVRMVPDLAVELVINDENKENS